MIKEASAMKLRQNLGEIINEIQYLKSTFIITKGSKPVAVMIDINTFDRVKEAKKRFAKMTQEIQKAFKNSDAKKVNKDIDNAIKLIRSQRDKKLKKNENHSRH